MNEIRTPGRNITVGETCRKLNPHLFAKLDPEAKAVLNGVVIPEEDKRAPKRIRQDGKPLLNKLEAEFKTWWEMASGNTLYSQSIRFRLANGLWYKPDFIQCCAVMGWTAFEVKGPHSFRGGFENLKMAATTYRNIKWVLAWKQDGAWQQQAVLP